MIFKIKYEQWSSTSNLSKRNSTLFYILHIYCQLKLPIFSRLLAAQHFGDLDYKHEFREKKFKYKKQQNYWTPKHLNGFKTL